jgi:hypothetical protein
MKRSEMLTLLSYKLQQQFDLDPMFLLESTDSVLSFLEEWGMKPPPVYKEIEYKFLDSKVVRGSTEYEWEPED